MHKVLTVPIPDEDITTLHVGDTVSLNGVIVTARDAAHKFLLEHFIRGTPSADEQALSQEIRQLLRGGVIYHCGPVVKKLNGGWQFVAAGPTTSIREEPFEPDVIAHFGVKAVIGKGGMGANTLKACQEHQAAYLHAIGGAATLIAQSVKEVLTVHKLEFGVPEAMWVIRVEDFPCVVTMDSHGSSIHADVLAASEERFKSLLA